MSPTGFFFPCTIVFKYKLNVLLFICSYILYVSVSGQYDTTILESALPSYTWTSSTLPSNASSATAFAYQSSTNNMSPGSSLLNTTSPSSLSGQPGLHQSSLFLLLSDSRRHQKHTNPCHKLQIDLQKSCNFKNKFTTIINLFFFSYYSIIK